MGELPSFSWLGHHPRAEGQKARPSNMGLRSSAPNLPPVMLRRCPAFEQPLQTAVMRSLMAKRNTPPRQSTLRGRAIRDLNWGGDRADDLSKRLKDLGKEAGHCPLVGNTTGLIENLARLQALCARHRWNEHGSSTTEY
jgi:hypothetical protein